MLLKLKKIGVLALLMCCSNLAFSITGSHQEKSAQMRVDEYKALRKACAITKGDQRQICFRQLREATQDYKKAKKELAMKQPEQADGPVIGQAQ